MEKPLFLGASQVVIAATGKAQVQDLCLLPALWSPNVREDYDDTDEKIYSRCLVCMARRVLEAWPGATSKGRILMAVMHEGKVLRYEVRFMYTHSRIPDVRVQELTDSLPGAAAALVPLGEIIRQTQEQIKLYSKLAGYLLAYPEVPEDQRKQFIEPLAKGEGWN